MLNLDIFPSAMLRGCLVCVICNFKSFHLLFLFIQTLPNDCLHIEDVHLLFCALFIIFFSFLGGVELRHIFPSGMLKGCLVCVICHFNSIHSFIFKLVTMIVHTFKMCTFYFVHVSYIFFSYF